MFDLSSQVIKYNSKVVIRNERIGRLHRQKSIQYADYPILRLCVNSMLTIISLASWAISVALDHTHL